MTIQKVYKNNLKHYLWMKPKSKSNGRSILDHFCTFEKVFKLLAKIYFVLNEIIQKQYDIINFWPKNGPEKTQNLAKNA